MFDNLSAKDEAARAKIQASKILKIFCSKLEERIRKASLGGNTHIVLYDHNFPECITEEEKTKIIETLKQKGFTYNDLVLSWSQDS